MDGGAAMASEATPGIKVLRGERLIDGTGRETTGRAVVVVEGTQIKAVGAEPEVRVPPGAEVFDLPGCTLMPGLIDCHIHLDWFNISTFKNHRVAAFEVAPELQMLYGLFHAQMCLEMGVTTLRHLGMINYVGLDTAAMVAVRDAIDAGIMAGPRLLVAGWTVITGAHLDLCLPRNALRQPGVTGDGPWELRKIARTNLRIGCDWIKTCASGGGGTDKEEPDVRNMTQEELEAIVDEAHAFHKRCAVHCFTPSAQKAAMRAGADTLEHIVFTDDEAITMMKAEGVPIVPTLSHRSDHAIDVRRRLGTSDFVLRKMKKIQPHTQESFKRIHQAGVKIAMGTDMGLDPEMSMNAGELEIYVSYGMTPMEAIQTATKNAAEAIGLGDQVGTLEAGKLADVVVVEGNPAQDIRVLQDKHKIKMVMKEGHVYVDRRPGHDRRVIQGDEGSWTIIDA
jgi:imidazolonepropionase-like amidohydrolase